MKTLLLDINSIVPYFTQGHATGVGRSTYELLKALEKEHNLPFNLILYTQNVKGIGVKNLYSVFQKLHIYIPRRPIINKLISSLKLKSLLCKYDLMHIPHNTDACEDVSKTIYTIHDLIVYRYPEMWNLKESEKDNHKYIAKYCKGIVTCSETSKRDICNFLGCDSEKITVIPWGINRDIFHPDNTPITEIPYLSQNFFFSSSCNHPRKQASIMIQAYQKYLEHGGTAQLVLLGASPEDTKPYQNLINQHKLLLIKGISDELLVKLYTQAKASIITSLFEGFGLPVLESLACHTQVICSRNSSLIEAGGDIIDYVDNPNPVTLANKMLDYDSECQMNILDIEKCEEHLSKFSWEKCAKRYIEYWNLQLNEV